MKFNDNNILLKEWLERYNKQNESIKKRIRQIAWRFSSRQK